MKTCRELQKKVKIILNIFRIYLYIHFNIYIFIQYMYMQVEYTYFIYVYIYLLNINITDEENCVHLICGCGFVLCGFWLKLQPGAGRGKYIHEAKEKGASQMWTKEFVTAVLFTATRTKVLRVLHWLMFGLRYKFECGKRPTHEWVGKENFFFSNRQSEDEVWLHGKHLAAP